MGEGGGEGEAVAYDQSRHVAAHGHSQERRRRGRLHPAGRLLHLCIVIFHAWPIYIFRNETILVENIILMILGLSLKASLITN